MRSSSIIGVAAICGVAAFFWCLASAPREEPSHHIRSSTAAVWPHRTDDLAAYVRRFPDRPGAWYELAQRRQSEGDDAGALEAWHQTESLARAQLDRDAGDPALPYMLARSRAHTGDADGAKSAYAQAALRYQAALAQNGSDAMLWHDLGWCKEALGDHPGALNAWGNAAQIQGSPETASAGDAYNLACFRALTGDQEGAFTALERAASLGWSDWQWALADDDLRAVRGLPRFDQNISHMRSQASQFRGPMSTRRRIATPEVIDPR